MRPYSTLARMCLVSVIAVFYLQAQILSGGSKAASPEAAKRAGCSLSASQFGDLRGQLLTSSGVQFIDQAFYVELNGLSYRFGVKPSAFFLNQPGVANGFATPEQYDAHFADGSVVFTLVLIQDELQKTGAYNNFTMPAIMAHEFGHIYQFKNNSSLPTKLLELQADYLAGWYMGNREGASGYGLIAFQQAMRSFYEKGDYDFNSARHHGTGRERLLAVTEGFRNASFSLPIAFQRSRQFVSAMGVDSATGKNSSTPMNSEVLQSAQLHGTA